MQLRGLKQLDERYQNTVKYTHRANNFDQEYEFYYLQSRYYNPTLGRFLNSDNYTSTGQSLLGNNMFAYCGNNSILFADSTGSRAIPALRSEMSAGKRVVSNETPTSNTSSTKPRTNKSSASRTSFAVMLGYNLNIFGSGFQATINFVSTKNNFGLQCSYYYSKDSELSKKNNAMMGIDIGPYAGIQVTGKASMEELTGLSRATGGDLVGGFDVITDENGNYIGWQLGASLKSANMHSLYTNTQTIFSISTIDLPKILVNWAMGE